VQDWKDRAVLITGAGRGIGKRLALGFAAVGAPVGLLGRTRAEIDLASLEIEHAGGSALRLYADVRDYSQVRVAVDRMTAAFGGVHILIAGASIQGPIGPLVSADPGAWSDVITVNVVGVMHAFRAVLPAMLERRSGKIIALSGGGVRDARPNFTAYAASKTAVARLVETLAEEVRDHNVQVNAMAPGGTYTHMTDEIIQAGLAAGEKEMEDATKIRASGGTPAEKQIQLALFLASERSNHISGKLIHVNDDWKRLEQSSLSPEIFTLRRIQKI